VNSIVILRNTGFNSGLTGDNISVLRTFTVTTGSLRLQMLRGSAAEIQKSARICLIRVIRVPILPMQSAFLSSLFPTFATKQDVMRIYLLLILTLFSAAYSFGQEVIQLYSKRPPGSENWTWSEAINDKNAWNTRVVYNVSQPTLTAFLPDPKRATGSAVVIAPGGGFHALSIDSEGNDVAEWLVSKGIAAFVLKYRVVHSETTDPVEEMNNPPRSREEKDRERDTVIQMATQDGLTAIRYVRQNARKYGLDAQKIGMIGFSAGGTVAMSAVYEATDSDRPNFVAPIYAYTGSITEHKIPTAKTPIFICVAADDQLQLLPHSTDLFNKWQAAGQSAELHVYHNGGHGFGMRPYGVHTDTWYQRFTDWMGSLGYARSEIPNSKWARQWNDRLSKDYSYQNRYQNSNQKLQTMRKRIVLIGDSITEGWADQEPQFFTEHNLIGRGISGQTTPQILLRFRQDVLDLKPETVVILAGINDIAENTGPYNEDFTFGNLVSMCELAKANKIKVVLASVLPASELVWRPELGKTAAQVNSLNTRLGKYAKANKIKYLDYHSAMQNAQGGLDADLAADGVHPTPKGYAVMRALLLKAIK
jgi:lysophospholipase L1-like esterase/acetyl esterase/lipase